MVFKEEKTSSLSTFQHRSFSYAKTKTDKKSWDRKYIKYLMMNFKSPNQAFDVLSSTKIAIEAGN
jgi:hypothetical protein